jgi:hypothetical protein
MKTKKIFQKQLSKRGRSITISYINMILKGSANAGYPLAKVIAEETDTTPDLWCDSDKAALRKVAFNAYSTVRG